jgi:hypothetical protein
MEVAEGMDRTLVEDFLRRYAATPPRKRSRVAQAAPLSQVQAAARQHPDPFLRRACVDFLDHHANGGSFAVFVDALADPAEPVRQAALHSIACETCRRDDLCVGDVVPRLLDVLARDASPAMRHKAVPTLLRLAPGEARAVEAIRRAADEDPDDLVRAVAVRALAGKHIGDRKTYARRARSAQRLARRGTPA